MKRLWPRLLLLGVFGGALYFFISNNLGAYFALDYLKSQQESFNRYYETHGWQTIGVFMAAYIAVAALSLPGATILTLMAGAMFGAVAGTFIVSFASTVGASCAFLVARFLLRDWVQKKFGPRLTPINQGIERDGRFYLFTLRLVPAFPFFVVNSLMGLTPISLRSFYWVSQIGMLPATFVYVNAGTQLAKIESMGGILSPTLLVSFALLGIFPLIAKKIISLFAK